MSGDKGSSGEVRFSIEDLLYYAPRFIGVGETLAAAGKAAERRLLGPGSFWGSSSPDKAFAQSYPASQYALLLVVEQLAVGLQGIGGGIQMMARHFAISEADIQRDMQRIARAAGDESALLSHTGGLPDAPPAPAVPTVQISSGTPTPTAQQPPTPSANGPAPSVHHTARRTGSIPSPSPGAVPDPEAWKRVEAKSFVGPWPSGDPERMDEAAAAWKDLASALDTAWSEIPEVHRLCAVGQPGRCC